VTHTVDDVTGEQDAETLLAGRLLSAFRDGDPGADLRNEALGQLQLGRVDVLDPCREPVRPGAERSGVFGRSHHRVGEELE